MKLVDFKELKIVSTNEKCLEVIVDGVDLGNSVEHIIFECSLGKSILPIVRIETDTTEDRFGNKINFKDYSEKGWVQFLRDIKECVDNKKKPKEILMSPHFYESTHDENCFTAINLVNGIDGANDVYNTFSGVMRTLDNTLGTDYEIKF